MNSLSKEFSSTFESTTIFESFSSAWLDEGTEVQAAKTKGSSAIVPAATNGLVIISGNQVINLNLISYALSLSSHS